MRRTVLFRTITALVVVGSSAALAGCGTGSAEVPVAATDEVVPSAAPSPTAIASTEVVMVIRHGEKPDGSQKGVDADGAEDDSSLTPTGWDRARRLADLFDPERAFPRPGLARPTTIYAAGVTDDAEGQRTRETVAPLADALGVPVNTEYGRGEEKELVDQVTARPGVTLVSWQHGGITEIADEFPDVTPEPPQEWPDDRFDVVWVFTRTADGWHFSQVPELVLPQDSADVIDE
jgi:broad specificity phosphatase PhoE